MSGLLHEVTWQDFSELEASKLNQMVANDVHLSKKMITGQVSASVTKTDGIKLIAGRILVPTSTSDKQAVNVRFSGIFTPGCIPVITHGMQNAGPMKRISVTFMGLTASWHDHNGVRFWVTSDHDDVKKRGFANNMYVNWAAYGW